jgi:hypothetical protein
MPQNLMSSTETRRSQPAHSKDSNRMQRQLQIHHHHTEQQEAGRYRSHVPPSRRSITHCTHWYGHAAEAAEEQKRRRSGAVRLTAHMGAGHDSKNSGDSQAYSLIHAPAQRSVQANVQHHAPSQAIKK